MKRRKRSAELRNKRGSTVYTDKNNKEKKKITQKGARK
jgi:hypothetical protein